MADHPHVLVVGAGIMGAAIAWHLCRGGARVTILEGDTPGGIATAGSLAWINASWGHRDDYFRLRFQAMADWRRLEAMVPALRVAWTGGLLWDMPADRMAAFAADHTARGYPVRTVDRAEAARIEPALAAPPEAAVHAAGEGAVEPLDAALALIAAARAHGATLIADRPARAIERRAGRVVGVATDAGPLSADMVVISAGAGTAALAGTAGIALPVDDPPALLLATRPHPPILRGFVLAPELHVRQARDGRLMAGAGFDGGDVADAGAHAFARLRRMLRGGEALQIDWCRLGHRPIPRDGLPIVGRPAGAEGLYLAVLHSGITLAPAIGRLAGEEILTGRRDPLLGPFGPDRFA